MDGIQVIGHVRNSDVAVVRVVYMWNTGIGLCSKAVYISHTFSVAIMFERLFLGTFHGKLILIWELKNS